MAAGVLFFICHFDSLGFTRDKFHGEIPPLICAGDPSTEFTLRYSNGLEMIYNENMGKILLIDKEAGWTSFDVVAKVRSALRKQSTINNQQTNGQKPKASSARTKVRVGHAGTLDPFATGLLIVLTGDETKNQDKYMKLPKEYEATLRLGYESTTGDPEGVLTQSKKLKVKSKKEVEETLKQFIGEINQVPPKYSAIKIKGKKAYELAREGKKFELKPRIVILYSIEVQSYKFPELSIKVRCSSGTYIRTLAEDIGKALGCGAYLTALRRTKIGSYSVDDALTVDKFNETC